VTLAMGELAETVRDGQMVLRWCAAGMNEAAKQFTPG